MKERPPEPVGIVDSPVAMPIDRVTVEATGGQDGSGFEIWREVCRPILNVASRGPTKTFETAFNFCDVDGLVFNRVSYSATQFQRTSRHLRGGEGDLILVHMLLSGCEEGEVDGREFRMDPTRVIVQDWAHAYETRAEASEQISVAIPRERLAARDLLYEKRPVIEWSHDSPQGRMVGHALRGIWESLPNATQADAPAMAAGFLGLLNGLLDPAGESAAASVPGPCSAAAMKDFLVRRLHQPRLGIDDVVEAFTCSRSTVYRLFQKEGGVRAFVADQRLMEAFRILTRFGGCNRPIVEIATQLGFQDVSYFHRAFKRRFGITAGEAAEIGAGQNNEAAGPAHESKPMDLGKLHQWFGAEI